MRRIILFLLGQKGYEVLHAAARSGFTHQVQRVVVGSDPQVHEDYAGAIVDLCDKLGIRASDRREFSSLATSVDGLIAVAAGWRWLIREPFLQVIVFHDSLLPRYRGFNPLVTALLRKDPTVGVTALIANESFDRGPIFGSRSVDVDYPVKIADAIQQMSALYFDLALSVFSALDSNVMLEGSPQNEAEASYSVWRDEEDYRIEWSASADAISHFINCVSYPYRGASTRAGGATIRILEAEPVADLRIANRDVGKVLFVDDGKPVVICGTGLLRIDAAHDDHGNDALPFKKFRTRLS